MTNILSKLYGFLVVCALLEGSGLILCVKNTSFALATGTAIPNDPIIIFESILKQ